MYKVKFYLKSGNIVEVFLKNFEWETKGGEFKRLKWANFAENEIADPKLDMIAVDQLEAIVSKKV